MTEVPPSMSTPSILVVGRDQAVAAALVRRIRELKYRIAGTAATGEQALALAREKRPALVVMNVALPGRPDSLYAVAGTFRRDLDLPVLLLTNSHDTTDTSGSHGDTADHYLLYPCTDDDLRNRIETVLWKDNAEEHVRLNHQRLQSVIDNVQAAIYAKDADGRFVLSNTYHAALLGCTPTDVIGKRDADFNVGAAHAREYAHHDRRVWETGQAADFEEVVTQEDGDHHYVSAKFPLLDAEARIYAVCGISTDITVHKQAERELQHLNHDLEKRVGERTRELAASEKKFRNLLESTHDIPFRLETTGILSYVGPQVRRYGLDPATMEGRHFLDLILPEDRERLAGDFRRTLEHNEFFPSEFRLQSSDGRITWFEERSGAHYDATGSLSGLTGVLRDITDRKAAESREQAALKRLQSFEAAVNQGPAVVCRWRIAPGEWPLEMISANVRQFGYEAEDFTSGRVSWPNIVHPDDMPRLETEVSVHLKKGIRSFRQHYRLLTKSGQVRQVEDWNVVIVSADGTPTHVQGVIMDATHHRREEQRRRESEERYQRLFEAESDAIMVLDAETRQFVDVNEAAVKLYGYSRAEFLGLTHWDITAETEASDTSIQRAIQDKQGRIPLRWHRKKDGTVFPVEIAPSRFMLNGKDVLCGIVRDITERKKAEDLRKKQADRLRELAAGLASAQDDEQRRIAQGLHDDVAQLLAACRFSLGLAPKVEDPVKVRELHDEAADLLQQAIEKVRSLSFELSSSTLCRLGLKEALEEFCESVSVRHGIEVAVRGGRDAGRMDEETATVLFKAARELIFNVVKHAGTREAFVRLSRTGKALQLAVEDRGRGFPQTPEDNHIGTGTGLGLFGIRERLRDLGGTMRIESEPGSFTRVTLTVPVAANRDGD
mgnify:CR=1 FL=1